MFSDEYRYRRKRESFVGRRTFLTGLGIAAGLYIDKKFLKGAIGNGAENVVTGAVDGALGLVTSPFNSSGKSNSGVENEKDSQEQNNSNIDTDNLIPILEGSKARLAGVSLRGILKIIDYNRLYENDAEGLDKALNGALEYAVNRVGVAPASPFTVAIVQGDSRTGVTEFDDPATKEVERLVQAFAGPGDTTNYTGPVLILAHEFVHQISHDALNNRPAETSLSEGLATWGALKYWIGSEDIKGYLLDTYKNNLIWPMFGEETNKDYWERQRTDFDYKNQIYYQWAGWCDFLIDTHGRDKFRELYPTGNSKSKIGESDYKTVYGITRSVMEDQWREEWLK